MKGYKNDWFAKQLVNASAKKTLEEAAPEWQFSHFGYQDKGGNCQVCHTRIMKFVAIKNTKNGMFLLIGEDCYDKLLHYLATQKLEAITSLKSREQYIGKIKEYCKKEINEAFLKWFAGRKKLPENMGATLEAIKHLGYAPNIPAAEDVVSYYKKHRIFSTKDLLQWEEYGKAFRYFPREEIPKKVTLAELDDLKKSLAAKLQRWHRDMTKKVRGKIKAGKFFAIEAVHFSGDFFEVSFSGFMVSVPITALSNRLEGSWKKSYAELFQKALPSEIRLEEPYPDSFWLDEGDLRSWVGKTRMAIYESETPGSLKLAVANGASVKLNSPRIEHFSGEFNGSYYSTPPSLELVFAVDEVKCNIPLPREEIKYRLGKMSWSSKLTQLLSETIPVDIVPVVDEGHRLSVSKKDLEEWLSRVDSALQKEAIALKGKQKIASKKRKEEREIEALKRGLPKSATWGKIYEFDQDKELEERRQKALKIYFRKGFNKKRGLEQWEAWYNNRLYVLRMEDQYDPSEGRIPVEEIRELVPGKVVLVRKI